MKLYPFHSKELPDIQKKLFRRSRGVQATLNASGDTTIEFTIPYAWCKITTMEIVGLPQMMKADLMILDSESSIIQAQMGIPEVNRVPKLLLNQFGFDVNAAANYYRDHSEYDADLYVGMIIKVVIKNHTDLTPTVGINFTLHEVV